MGDTALTHRDLARAGLVVSGATVSADGRLGAGRGVRAAAAAGADWTAEPLAALWSVPVAHQVARALAAGAAKAPGPRERTCCSSTPRSPAWPAKPAVTASWPSATGSPCG